MEKETRILVQKLDEIQKGKLVSFWGAQKVEFNTHCKTTRLDKCEFGKKSELQLQKERN